MLAQNLAHGDIKDENILVDHNFNVRVIDFGATSFLHQRGTPESFIGTMHYASPEILLGAWRCQLGASRVPPMLTVRQREMEHLRWLLGGEFDHAAAEVWTLGILLYTMIVGTSPFNSSADAINGRYKMPRYVSIEAYAQSRS